MKTDINQIKHTYARELGYDDWNEVIYSSSDPDKLDVLYDEVAKRYAMEVAKEALKNASENADIKMQRYNDLQDIIAVDKESILNENNIPEL